MAEAQHGSSELRTDRGVSREHPRASGDQAQPAELDFDKGGGLVTCVTQDNKDMTVLMVATMNREAWHATLTTGYAHYYSRSRGRLWKKGEESGNTQEIREIRVDCDQDAVLLLVHQHGPGACHTGNRSCFYRRYEGEKLVYAPREQPAD